MKNLQTLNRRDENMMTIMNLVRESKLNGIEEKDVWETLLKHRWSNKIVLSSGYMTESQLAELIFKIGNELKLKYDDKFWIPEEDSSFGIALYSAIYCPKHIVEAVRLSVFYQHILMERNLNSVVATTMHNLQPMTKDTIADFTAINMWYDRLDQRYNFSLGPEILGLLKSNDLAEIAKLDPPYLKKYSKQIHDSLTDREDEVDSMSSVNGKTVNIRDECIVLRKGLLPSEPPTSPDFNLEFCFHPVLCLPNRFKHL